ncbi:thioredoxin domain-containing protein 15 [Anopheles cruzii]|uniref:thioredoxin domain-containing protein 15 n=1 Tax=Anopheles cruzii TaxID=68878 RepID=UPI0022EC7443|nr:thioredoxin domain-containing protein 15 [Anopheles cruzii]
MNSVKFSLALTLGLILVHGAAIATAYQFTSFEFYAQFLNGEFLETNLFGGRTAKAEAKVEETVQQPRDPQAPSYLSGVYEYLTYWDRRYCSLAGESRDPSHGNQKPPLRVECIPTNGNGTLKMITSLKEVVSVLAPHGNSTKRNQAGSCVVMLFYSKTCIFSAMMAPHFNALARHFYDLTVAAIDANEFHVLNAEFGIVGLPTIMFFHQGRPLVKYNRSEISVDSLWMFVTRHSGMEPMLANRKKLPAGHYTLHYISDDFKGPLSNKVEYKTDYWLYVAWAFIIVCTCFYFSKSTVYAQIIETIKRNWRESAAHHS